MRCVTGYLSQTWSFNGTQLLIHKLVVYNVYLVPLKWPACTSLYTCSSTRLLYPGSNVYQQWFGPDSAGDLIWPNVEFDRANSRSAFMVMLHTETDGQSVWLYRHLSVAKKRNIIFPCTKHYKRIIIHTKQRSVICQVSIPW